MPRYIKDNETTELVARLAKLQGLSMQGAVKLAVEEALDKVTGQASVQDRLRKLWAENPLPVKTGTRADKAFLDDLSGDL